MKPAVIVDTGPIVALLNRRDRFHEWARGEFAGIEPPALTCEPVLSEACFLLRGFAGGSAAVLDVVRRGLLAVPFRLDIETDAVKRLMERYADVPMSLADACLARMTEQHPAAVVVTLDSDFRIYRREGRKTIPVRIPAELGGRSPR